jgi:hypothetical protein
MKNELLIKNMILGQVGYAAPWAVTVYEDGTAVINGEYKVYPKPGGTVQLRVGRTQEGVFIWPESTAGKHSPYATDGFEWRITRHRHPWGTPLPVAGKPFHLFTETARAKADVSWWKKALSFLWNVLVR